MVVVGIGLLWLAAEVVLQVRQWFQGGRGSSWEWRSFAALGVVGALAGNIAPPLARALPWPGGSTTLLVVGLVVAVSGIALRLWSIVSLGRFFRGVVNVQADQHVVRRGPYRVLRHPSYTGAIVGILGFMIVSGSLAALAFVMALVIAGLAYRIHAEERVLRGALGDEYDEYAATTPRLVPGVW